MYSVVYFGKLIVPANFRLLSISASHHKFVRNDIVESKKKQQSIQLWPREDSKSGASKQHRMFGSLSRLAGDALKSAKHATDQLAQAAQHAASTSDLTSLAKVRGHFLLLKKKKKGKTPSVFHAFILKHFL